MFYVILLLVFILIYLLPIKTDNIKFFSILTILVIITAIRSGIGADYYSYYFIYNKIDKSSLFKTLSLNLRVEPLFRTLMFLFKKNNFSPEAFLGAISVIILLVGSTWIFRNSKDKTLSLILYYSMFYFVWALSALRQGIVLALGSYFFYSSENKRSIKQDILIIMILSLFHLSALIYIPFIILRKMPVKNITIIKIFLISIIVSFLPWTIILNSFTKYQIIDKLLAGNTKTFPMLSFSYQVRLLMAFLGIYFLLNIKNNDYLNYLLQSFIIGFSLYFLISFSESAASRAGIYSYFLIILIIPNILDYLDYLRFRRFELPKYLIYLPIFIFMFVSIYKELIVLPQQLSYLGKEKLIPFNTIFSPSIEKYGNKESHIIQRELYDELLLNEFESNLELVTTNDYSNENEHILVYSNKFKQSLIINQKGEIVSIDKIPGKLSLYNGVIVSEWQMPLFSELRYFDITNNNRGTEELKDNVLSEIEKDMQFNQSTESKIDINFTDLPKETQILFTNKDALQNIYLYKVEKPFIYHVLVAEYQFSKHHVYLDEGYTPLMDYIFIGKGQFDKNGFLRIRHQTVDLIFNKYGKIIWVE